MKLVEFVASQLATGILSNCPPVKEDPIPNTSYVPLPGFKITHPQLTKEITTILEMFAINNEENL